MDFEWTINGVNHQNPATLKKEWGGIPDVKLKVKDVVFQIAKFSKESDRNYINFFPHIRSHQFWSDQSQSTSHVVFQQTQ